VFVRDRQVGTTERVSVASDGTQGDDSSAGPALSVEGRFVAFHSVTTNLVAGDTNGTYDVFVHDRPVPTTTTSTTQPATTTTLSTVPTTTVTTAPNTTVTTASTTTVFLPSTTTTTLRCELAQLPEDSLAGVECVIGAVRATLNEAPPACGCKHCSLEPALDRMAGRVMRADGATSPKKCERNLRRAGRAAKALRARVASLTLRKCLAPDDRVATLDSEIVDLASRTRALLKSRFCASK